MKSPSGTIAMQDREMRNTILEWTRSNTFYNKLNIVLEVTSVFMSWDVRQVMLKTELNRLLNKPEKEIALKKQREAFENSLEFFISTYSSDKQWSAIDTDESIWKVCLVNKQNDVLLPYAIEKIEPNDAEILSYFPFVTQWNQSYKLKFPVRDAQGRNFLVTDSTEIELRFSSILGHLSLYWNTVTQPVEIPGRTL